MLGVLGGMGPLASAQFMVRLTQLTPAARDQDHIPTVLWSDPRVPDRTVRAAERRGRSAALAAARRRGPEARRLRRDRHPVQHRAWLVRGDARCGAGADPAHRRCRRGRAAPDWGRSRAIGVMATRRRWRCGFTRTGLAALGWDCIVPTPDEMDRLVSPAIALVKLNRMAEAYPPLARWCAASRPAAPWRWCWAAPRSRSASRPDLRPICRWWTRSTPWPGRQSSGRDRSRRGRTRHRHREPAQNGTGRTASGAGGGAASR